MMLLYSCLILAIGVTATHCSALPDLHKSKAKPLEPETLEAEPLGSVPESEEPLYSSEEAQPIDSAERETLDSDSIEQLDLDSSEDADDELNSDPLSDESMDVDSSSTIYMDKGHIWTYMPDQESTKKVEPILIGDAIDPEQLSLNSEELYSIEEPTGEQSELDDYLEGNDIVARNGPGVVTGTLSALVEGLERARAEEDHKSAIVHADALLAAVEFQRQELAELINESDATVSYKVTDPASDEESQAELADSDISDEKFVIDPIPDEYSNEEFMTTPVVNPEPEPSFAPFTMTFEPSVAPNTEEPDVDPDVEPTNFIDATQDSIVAQLQRIEENQEFIMQEMAVLTREQPSPIIEPEYYDINRVIEEEPIPNKYTNRYIPDFKPNVGPENYDNYNDMYNP